VIVLAAVMNPEMRKCGERELVGGTGFWRMSACPGNPGRAKVGEKLSGYLHGDAVLEVEQVPGAVVEAPGPQRVSVLSPHELGRHANPLARSADASLQQMVNSKRDGSVLHREPCPGKANAGWRAIRDAGRAS